MDEPSDDRFSESEEVNFYAVIPAIFEPTMTALEPTYTRTFEGAAWNDYLSRRLRPQRHNDLLVYGWKYDQVSIREPARVYGSFAFHRSSPIVTLVSAVALSSIVVGLVVWLANAYLPADPIQVISQLGSDGSRWLRWLFLSVIGGGSLLALLSKVTALREIGKIVRTRVRNAADWLDRKLATDTNYDA